MKRYSLSIISAALAVITMLSVGVSTATCLETKSESKISYGSSQIKASYKKAKKTTKSKKKSKKKKSKKSKLSKKLRKLKKKINAYNKRIYRQGQGRLNKKTIKKSPFNLKKYGIKSNVYGRVKIKKIGVDMPIYLGCNEKTMSAGVAHLSQTSIPLGGKNTNSILAGHNGWGGKTYFKNLSKVKKGDKVKITTPFNKLTYVVKKTKILHSNKLNKMLIKTGKDRVTLFTCLGAPGTRKRYVCFCERKK